MKKTIMKKSILADANLSNANLQQSSISQTRLDGTNLRNAILQDADLSWSMFDNADLTSANLSGVQLDNTNFRLVKFNEANLEGVDFRLAMNHVKSTYGIAVNLPEKDFSINCDPRKMEGVMSNLLNNSVQAVDGQGEIDVTMSSNSKFLTIQVKDSGPGIPDLDLEKIFEPMYTTKTTGTGLGLVICKSIVEQHGGSISVSNKPTTFTITLPF
jgi:signal transduction histidine kinase